MGIFIPIKLNTMIQKGQLLLKLLFLFVITSSLYGFKNYKVNPLDSTTGLVLPSGFVASIIADTLGPLRHLAISKEGGIYVKLNSLKKGVGILYLTDDNKDGVIDHKVGFGNYPGTGIIIKNNFLYASSNSAVYRYALNEKGQILDTAHPQIVVKGLMDKKRDNSKSLAIDDKDNLYVSIGSYSEVCREEGSGRGIPGCPLLDSVGGIWQFKTNLLEQSYPNSVHYARGLKNVVGMNWNTTTNSLFVTMHGRGAFDDKFPQYYTAQQSDELPAETLFELHSGDDAGWPFIYYDPTLRKNMLAPEYGGNGKKSVKGKYISPTVAFPAHLGPNDLLFYTGTQFPEKYKGGAFIVFHNKSKKFKIGYMVAFVPYKNGKPSGDWEIFADNFAGVDLKDQKESIEHRPMGIAQGPDGSLYVTDDLKGTIYQIKYTGGN